MNDLISRQAAVDAAKNIIAKHEARMVEYSEGEYTHLKHSNRADGAEEVLYQLENLPSVRKEGKWLWVEDETNKNVYHLRCSECNGNGYDENNNYCPHCGAEMENGDE